MNRRPLILGAAVTVGALSLLAVGCGGGGSPSVANVAPTTTAAPTPQNGLLAFSQCMRSNGLSNFPDPQHFAGGNVKLTIRNNGYSGPRFQAAMNACSHLLPGNGPQQTTLPTRAQVANELSFASCMRSHGLARFPDPNAHGELSVEMVQAQGIDVHSPHVLHIVTACLPASHGWLTAEKVKEAVAHAGH